MRIAVLMAVAGLGLLTIASARGQDQVSPPPTAQTPPGSADKTPNAEEVTAVPNRPTFASTAEMVEPGMFEIEYGFEAAKGHQNINGLLKWGAVKNLELWFLHNPIARDAGVGGLGDCGAGFKYKVFAQANKQPTLGILYIATLPTASHGQGGGAMAHLAQILVSKDFGRHHIDFNEGVQFVGRPQLAGFDRRYFTSLAYSLLIMGKWGYTGEIAGYSRQNATTAATMTLLNAATYNMTPRLVLDAGAYFAAYGQLPRFTVFAGVTYSVANLYHLGSRQRSPKK